MPGKVIRIERMNPRPGGVEEPHWTTRGYQLADPKFGDSKHIATNALYVRSLDEVADHLGRGYSLWMTRKGKRPSLISPGSLRVIRA